jgi:enoyl-CoA hydratase/carnithine racemase
VRDRRPMSNDLVLWSVLDRVCTLTFHRPERHNAWTHEMEHEYFQRLDDAAEDDEVRAIVVTGSGSSFCPGADTRDLSHIATDGGLVLSGRRSQHYGLTIPKPMIAAVNGACAGIGLVQALVCDVRFAAHGARFTTAYARLGVAAEYGMSWILPRLVGVERALDLLLSARVFDADEALRLGLVSRVCAPEDVLSSAQEYAGELARRCAPRAMAAIRRQVWGDLSKGWKEANEDWLEVMREFNEREQNPDMVEGIAALVEKRLPNFGPIPNDLRLPAPPPLVDQ